MDLCEAKMGGACTRPATWKQAMHAGPRDQGRFTMFASWCDEHAEKIVQKHRREWLAPPRMTPLVAEAT
jgi:hypothetical protein